MIKVINIMFLWIPVILYRVFDGYVYASMVFDNRILLSRFRKTTSSVTFGVRYSSSLAVDGHYENNDYTKCFCTQRVLKTFWMVELAIECEIEAIFVSQVVTVTTASLIGSKPELLSDKNVVIGYCNTITRNELIFMIHCNKTRANKVRIWGMTKGYLQFCEVDVCGVPSLMSLLSRNKPTIQSSTKDGLNSSLAVNGNYKQTSGCTLTNSEIGFWIVDLQGSFLIEIIHLYNRVDLIDRFLGAAIELLSRNNEVLFTCHVIYDKQFVYYIPCFLQKAEKIRIRQSNKNFLNICQIDVFGGNPVNLARGKPTSQSSNYRAKNPTFLKSSYAVDGDYNQYMNIGKCATTHYEMAYWMVDFEGEHRVHSIYIYNRKDCCPERILGAAVELLNSTNNVVHLCGSLTEVKTIYNLTCDSKSGHKLRIRSTREDTLTICEVDVFGY